MPTGALTPALVLSLVTALVTYTLTSQALHREQTLFATQELELFADRYGPAHATQFGEEWLVRDFFKDKRGGIFVDIGANHHQIYSMTHYLETQLGWSGIAIEAQASFAPGWAEHRPRTKFFAMFATDTTGEPVKFYVPDMPHALSASGNQEMVRSVPTTETTVPSTTLNAALETAGITAIDFLSMDIELFEPKALAGFDIDRYKPALAGIETHPAVRQAILNYFDAHGYVVVGKYLRADVNNLYFMPGTR